MEFQRFGLRLVLGGPTASAHVEIYNIKRNFVSAKSIDVGDASKVVEGPGSGR